MGPRRQEDREWKLHVLHIHESASTRLFSKGHCIKLVRSTVMNQILDGTRRITHNMSKAYKFEYHRPWTFTLALFSKVENEPREMDVMQPVWSGSVETSRQRFGE